MTTILVRDTRKPPRGQCGKRPSIAVGVYWPRPITGMEGPCDRPQGHGGLCAWALVCVSKEVAAEILKIQKETE